VCSAAKGLAFAVCLGVPLSVARAALLAAGPAAARLNRPLPDPHAPPKAAAAGGKGGGADKRGEEEEGGELLELRAWMVAGGPMAGVSWDTVRSLATLYDEPYSHKTDAHALRAAAAAAGCTHVVVGAAGEGAASGLEVAAVGALEAALGGTNGDETRVSHGTHWYCCAGKSLGFAPNGDIKLNIADGSNRGDPLRLCWCIDGTYGGWRAGNVLDLHNSSGDAWRKLVWGFRL
jgi:hypothetical protein